MSHTAERLYTVEELPDISDCYELVDGELIMMMSPAGLVHGYLIIKIGSMLNAYVEEKNLGMVFGEQTGFILTRHPDTVRAPDAAFVCDARLSSMQLGDGYFPGYPDLAVEILSSSNRPSTMRRKIDQYFSAGTRLVWVVSPSKRTIVVHSLLHPSATLHEADTLDGEDVLPGFHYKIAQLFARLNRA